MWPWDIDWDLTLKYVEVYLSWPVLASILAAFFLTRFQNDISTFLGNVRPKAPGFEPAFIEQPYLPLPRTDLEAAVEDVTTAAAAAADQAALAEITKIEEFRYLNRGLVLNTQRLLNGVAKRGTLPLEELEWLFADLSGEQRSTMVATLYQHDLVRATSNSISITLKGDEYAHWPERVAWVDAQISIVEGNNLNRLMPRGANALTSRLSTAPGLWFREGDAPKASPENRATPSQ